jgi:hypothetical protein
MIDEAPAIQEVKNSPQAICVRGDAAARERLLHGREVQAPLGVFSVQVHYQVPAIPVHLQQSLQLCLCSTQASSVPAQGRQL